MFPFTRLGPIDRTELKALLFAFLFCCLFITFLIVVHPPTWGMKKVSIHVMPPPTKFLEQSKPRLMDPLERFRVVPEDFKQVDFKNYSYGLYTVSEGKRIDLTLLA